MNWEMFAKLRVQWINSQTISALRYNSFIIWNCCRTNRLKDFVETRRKHFLSYRSRTPSRTSSLQFRFPADLASERVSLKQPFSTKRFFLAVRQNYKSEDDRLFVPETSYYTPPRHLCTKCD